MIINLIVVRAECPIETTYWTTEAWDEWTVDENPQGFDEAIEKAKQAHGTGQVRVLRVKLPEGALAKPFEVPTVEGDVQT